MKRNRRARRYARNALLTTATVLLSVLLTQRVLGHVENKLEQQSLSLSRLLFEQLHKPVKDTEKALSPQSHHISLNGAEFLLQTTSVRAPLKRMHAALRHFAVSCAPASPPDAHDSLKRAESRHWQRLSLPQPSLLSLSNTESFSHCLRPSKEWTLAALMNNIERFAKTGDLNAVGQMHATYVRSHGDQHTLLMISSVGALRPRRMFPTTGDVEGEDFAVLPRPQGARRLAIALDKRPQLTSYASALSPHQALRSFLKEVAKRQLTILSPGAGIPSDSLPTEQGLAAIIKSQDSTYIVVSTSQAKGSLLSVARLPS